MKIIFPYLLFMCAAALAWAFYGLFRSERVYKFRVLVLALNRDAYYALPPYNEMTRRWWVWPLWRFLPKEFQP